MGDSDILTKLIISVVIGIILGGEREYRNKSAGLRTIVLICVGSTIFAVLSHAVGEVSGGSRMAANVVTGIGFLGAGAIMRDGLTISGLTTASTIWVAAALGVAVGMGHYTLAIYALVLCFAILTIFSHFQWIIFTVINKTVELRISFHTNTDRIELVEAEMNLLRLRFNRKKEIRKNDEAIYYYDVIGKQENITRLASLLNKNQEVRSFEY